MQLSAAQPVVAAAPVQPAAPPEPLRPDQIAAKEYKEKMARNEALLDRLISKGNAEKSSVLDEQGIVEGVVAQRARKAPPRRAVTWVNEIR